MCLYTIREFTFVIRSRLHKHALPTPPPPQKKPHPNQTCTPALCFPPASRVADKHIRHRVELMNRRKLFRTLPFPFTNAAPLGSPKTTPSANSPHCCAPTRARSYARHMYSNIRICIVYVIYTICISIQSTCSSKLMHSHIHIKHARHVCCILHMVRSSHPPRHIQRNKKTRRVWGSRA